MPPRRTFKLFVALPDPTEIEQAEKTAVQWFAQQEIPVPASQQSFWLACRTLAVAWLAKNRGANHDDSAGQ